MGTWQWSDYAESVAAHGGSRLKAQGGRKQKKQNIGLGLFKKCKKKPSGVNGASEGHG